jgi:hypothetical protein
MTPRFITVVLVSVILSPLLDALQPCGRELLRDSLRRARIRYTVCAVAMLRTLVDSAGNFYGRVTLNQGHPQAIQSGKLLAWIAAVCSS